MPCWKQHLESVTVQRWTLPIKAAIKKTILGDSTLISCPEPPVTASYYLSYTSCSISAVDTLVTIAEWQLSSGRYLSCTKYSACKSSPWLGFQFSISLTCSQSTFKKKSKNNSFWLLWIFHPSQWSFSGFAGADCGPARCSSCGSPKMLFGKTWNLANSILLL